MTGDKQGVFNREFVPAVGTYKLPCSDWIGRRKAYYGIWPESEYCATAVTPRSRRLRRGSFNRRRTLRGRARRYRLRKRLLFHVSSLSYLPGR